MKYLKRIVTTLLMLSIVFSSTISASASELSTDQQLEQRGIPSNLIKIMPEEQKEEIIAKNLVFDSYKKLTLDSPRRTIGGVSTLGGTLSTDEMNFYCSVYKGYPWNSTDKTLTVYLNYDWLDEPNMTLTDCFGVGWDKNLWRLKPNSGMQGTYYQIAPSFTHDSRIESEFGHSLAYTSESGAGWNTDIKYAYGLEYVTHNYGYGSLVLEAKDPTKSGTDTLYINYSHAVGFGTVGLSFHGASVTYNGSADAYTVGNSYSFTY
ncbi:MAG: hypothetical protein Q4F88_07160 [Eubacteriales bacterium]|nr:hypothetical protein [Eubacteriales bacterium]